MRNTGLEEAQAGIKIAGRHISNLRYTDDTTLMAESEKELKSLLIKVKKENEKAGLKFNIQKTNIIASSPITSRQIDGETMERVADFIFIFLGSKITVHGDCSHEIKRHLLLRRKAMANTDSILKSRNITQLTKACLVKAMAFPVSWPFSSGCQSIRASASILSMNIQGGFPFGFTGLISLLPKGLSRVFSRTTVLSINSLVLSFFHSLTLTSICDY